MNSCTWSNYIWLIRGRRLICSLDVCFICLSCFQNTCWSRCLGALAFPTFWVKPFPFRRQCFSFRDKNFLLICRKLSPCLSKDNTNKPERERDGKTDRFKLLPHSHLKFQVAGKGWNKPIIFSRVHTDKFQTMFFSKQHKGIHWPFGSVWI